MNHQTDVQRDYRCFGTRACTIMNAKLLENSAVRECKVGHRESYLFIPIKILVKH